MIAPVLATPRCILRPHVRADFEVFAAMWADPVVTRHFGRTYERGESWTRFLRSIGLWPILGYGYWAVEDRANGTYLGLVGLADFERGIPAIAGIPEAGWVLASVAHGRGLATELVTATMIWADANINAPETCCIIDPGNAGSIRVAEKTGFVACGRAPFEGGETLVFKRPRYAAIRAPSSVSSST